MDEQANQRKNANSRYITSRMLDENPEMDFREEANSDQQSRESKRKVSRKFLDDVSDADFTEEAMHDQPSKSGETGGVASSSGVTVESPSFDDDEDGDTSDDPFERERERRETLEKASSASEKFANQFLHLERVKEMRRYWREKGISENDPIFFELDVMNEFYEAQKEVFHRIVESTRTLERSIRVQSESIDNSLSDVKQLEIEIAKSRQVHETTVKQLNELAGLNRRFAEELPSLHESYHKGIQSIQEHSVKRKVVERVTLIGGVVIGFLVGAWLIG